MLKSDENMTSVRTNMSTGKEKQRQAILNLLFAGYTQERIAKKLNISVRTVSRHVRKIREGSKTWMDDLAFKSFVHLYRESLEGIQYNIMYLRDMLDEESTKSDNHLRLKIIKQISDLQYKQGELLHKGPMVWSIDKVIKKKEAGSTQISQMESIWGNNN